MFSEVIIPSVFPSFILPSAAAFPHKQGERYGGKEWKLKGKQEIMLPKKCATMSIFLEAIQLLLERNYSFIHSILPVHPWISPLQIEVFVFSASYAICSSPNAKLSQFQNFCINTGSKWQATYWGSYSVCRNGCVFPSVILIASTGQWNLNTCKLYSYSFWYDCTKSDQFLMEKRIETKVYV